MKTYELQIYRDGNWKIDSFFDDRELAMFEAHRMEQSRRYSGIRVVEETHNPSTGKIHSRTLHQWTVTQNPGRRDRSAAEFRGVRRRPAAPAVAKDAGWRPVHLLLTFGGLILIGIAAVIMLRILAENV